MARIKAKPLHAQARQAVLERILRGELAPDTRVVESRLAEDLGVSRTPLREALMHLEREGFLKLEPNRGFFVAPLSAEEARELYPILAMMECEALRLGGLPGTARIEYLGSVNERLAEAAADSERAFQLNAEWHTILTSGCPNRTLLKMLAGVRRKMYRYEWASLPQAARIEAAAEQHAAIAFALEQGDADGAGRDLQEHWQTELDALLPRIGASADSSGGR